MKCCSHRTFAGILFKLILFQSCLAKSNFTFDPDQPIQYQNGKTKSSGYGGLSWLSRFQLPVPKSAYNATQVQTDQLEQNNFNQLLWDIEWWKYTLEGYTQKDIETPSNGYCNSTSYDNGTCQNDDWVGIPLYVEEDLNSWAQYVAFPGNNTMANYGTWIMEAANKTHNLQYALDMQIQNISSLAQKAYYRIIGDYMGTGIGVSCQSYISETLNAANQFDQAGWQAATTLMALIPALLTFGNLFVPRSSEAFGTSFLVGTMSAVFSLGLPVRSISGIPKKQVVDVSSFGFRARQMISLFGKQAKRLPNGQKRLATHPVTLQTLQKWSNMAPESGPLCLTAEQESTDLSFGRIKKRTLKWPRRAHLWHFPSFLVASVQLVLFFLAIGPLFLGFGTPILLFDCSDYWTSIWLLVSAAISAVVRFIMWERGAHERVKVYALSSSSVGSLRRLVKDTMPYDGDESKELMLGTTEMELPPLHPPMLTAVGNSIFRAYIFLPQLYHSYRILHQHSSTASSSLSALKKGYREVSTTRKSVYVGTRRFSITKTCMYFNKILWTSIVANLMSPLQFFQGGISKKPRNTSAMRWRPLVILMHLSTSGRNPLMTLWTGLVEGIVLVVLTVFFGAQWGGNLLVLCYVMGMLLVAITIGRALGLWYVCLSARVFALQIIECQTPRQIIGCLRILCSSTELLVFVNGAWYFEGHRLDERDGWTQWRSRYERGDYDDDETSRDNGGKSASYDIHSQISATDSNAPETPPKVSIGDLDGSGSMRLVSPIGSLRRAS